MRKRATEAAKVVVSRDVLDRVRGVLERRGHRVTARSAQWVDAALREWLLLNEEGQSTASQVDLDGLRARLSELEARVAALEGSRKPMGHSASETGPPGGTRLEVPLEVEARQVWLRLFDEVDTQMDDGVWVTETINFKRLSEMTMLSPARVDETLQYLVDEGRLCTHESPESSDKNDVFFVLTDTPEGGGPRYLPENAPLPPKMLRKRRKR